MVICKYFQQGTCRFGQYCKFEHIFANRSKNFGDEKNIALLVAEEVLLAERGGQWLLSCYGPFREKKCIPFMEDVSPEEVRWEMYKAQKNGTVDQINAQFQQLCETMKSKREILKNPTPAVVQLLEEIQHSGSKKTAFVKNSKLNKGNYPFGTSELATSNNNQSSNVFGQNPFATSGSQFSASTFNSGQSSASIFGRSTGNTTSIFGGKPNFGSSIFGGSSPAGATIFGGANQTTGTPFSATQNSPTFGGLASQGTSIFIGNPATQSTFGQPSVFGTNNSQINNSFLNPQTAQNSIFGGASSVGSSVFGNTTSTGAVPVPGESVFSSTSSVSNTTPRGSEIFGHSSTGNSGFGSAPVFSSVIGFGAAQSGTSVSVFGGQSGFSGSIPSSSSNIFGGSNIGATSFGALAQSTTLNTFGNTSANTGNNTFETAPNTTPFGAPISSTAGPFGAINTDTNLVFATTVSSVPRSFNNTITSFSKGATAFGFTTPVTDSTSAFGTTTAISSIQSPFSSTVNFSSAQPGSFVFANTTTTTTTVANPFVPKNSQQILSSPFNVSPSSQASPFGNVAITANNKAFGISLTVNMDETAYSTEESLTDDEKAAYRLAQFTEGYIPLRPPTKELS